jgi:hypothetical protein
MSQLCVAVDNLSGSGKGGFEAACIPSRSCIKVKRMSTWLDFVTESSKIKKWLGVSGRREGL